MAQNSAAQLPSAVSKYQAINPDDVLTNRAIALEMADRTRRTIVPTMHLVETEHFLVFSAWKPSHDAALGAVCEQMFQKLAQQFAVPSSASIWVGKCPIYVFWEPAHYARFVSEIDQSRELDPNMLHANGYHASRGPFSYVVISGASVFGLTLEEARIKFYHVLVHEGTHAFLHRYISERPLPVWMEEGLADYIAATLVPKSTANHAYLTAIRPGLAHTQTVRNLLNKESDLTPTEYGLAQSVVRFLVSQNPATLVRFVEAIKQGASQEMALSQVYHATDAALIQSWALYWQRALPKQG